TVELCRKYGKELALAVNETLDGSLHEVTGNFAAKYAEIALSFDQIPERSKWEAEATEKNATARARAKRFLKLLDDGGAIATEYSHYPVQVWTLGELRWVALGGEAVVDYSHRLKKELGGAHAVWITAYANDVMAYIPSERVLKEGGYEGDTSMIPYGLPSKWAPGIEDRIVAKVHELAGAK